MENRLAALESRLQELEDKQAIAEMIASYGPLVDSGAADEVAALWSEDGIYDVDEITMTNREQVRSMVHSTGHQHWIKAGCAHFLGPAKVTITGDTAVAVCHSLMVVNQGGRFVGRRGEASADPEAAAPEFVVRRATAHHFELARSDQGWVTTRRTSRVLDGRPEAPELLRRGAMGQPAQAPEGTAP
ncbi:nuclear transport factor 2 family protein [Nocardioides sp. AE5]|uniref:nuclear transport factor 2 family protein n=1 Tax=Nocardioides sp. AE5 TaxID=2962573 RepID=UPI0028824FD1|nr:nuclear transport factor 2 family protein [Nocardioides sp. AE5]MDT0203205.1 nuclear transport factor 2 family protein [Nocardioides sp. AE5]